MKRKQINVQVMGKISQRVAAVASGPGGRNLLIPATADFQNPKTT
jgi:hypothetical protein